MDTAVKQERLQGRLEPEIQAFRQERKTLQLATIDEKGMPNVSYAPFVQNQEGYFVLISEIARHARNLQVNPNVSLMMIEDESSANLMYARKRLTFDAKASIVERETELWTQVTEQLHDRFGDIIDNLTPLQDFILFKLTVKEGRYVKGFGKAYEVSGDDMVDVVHLDQGHRKIS